MSPELATDQYFSAFEDWLLNGDRNELSKYLAADEDPVRLNVYRNTFVAGSIDTLERRYPAVVHAVDAGPFRHIARLYTRNHPPVARSMTEYGQSFPEFLEDHEFSTYPTGLLSDLARLDRAWSNAYFAGEPKALTPQHIEEVAATIRSTSLGLNKVAQRVTTRWAITKIWSLLRDAPTANSMEIEAGSQHALLFRTPEGGIRYSILTDAQACFVDNIETGVTLSDAAEHAAALGPIDISEFFSTLITNQLLQKRE